MTGAKEPGPRGERDISRKTIAQGRPDDPPVPVVLPRAFLLHADRGCGGHPAFPAPSDHQKAQSFRKTRTHRAARSRRCVFSAL
jgi:hypothetical protein